MKFAKKSLGQNFLIDKNIINKIVNLLKIENIDVIEIGPGRILSGLVKRIDKKVKVSAINNEEDINKIEI